jgi:WD40 repeat protein
METGAISIWNTSTLGIEFSTDKHQGPITALAFFESWKLISGSSKGSVHIDNLMTHTNEVKRTNLFESKIDYSITNIQISSVGLAFVLD